MIINIDGRMINPIGILSAEIESRHYMNGSDNYLVVKLMNGETIRKIHDYEFNAFAKLDEIKKEMENAK